jgi:hypothetical protein
VCPGARPYAVLVLLLPLAARRIPGLKRILDLFDGSWQRALDGAGIRTGDLVAARANWVSRAHADRPSSVSQALTHLPSEAWDSIALDDDERLLVLRDGPDELLFEQAVGLACALSASLDWLGGLDHNPGTPPSASAALDGGRVRAARLRAAVSEQELARSLGWPVAAARRLVRGSAHPTLGEAAIVARTLRCSIDDLCWASPRESAAA